MLPLAPQPLAIWCHHSTPDFSRKLCFAPSRFKVPGSTSEWPVLGHMAMTELPEEGKRKYTQELWKALTMAWRNPEPSVAFILVVYMELGERGVLVLGFTPNHFNTGHFLAFFFNRGRGKICSQALRLACPKPLRVQVTVFGTKMYTSPNPVVSILPAHRVTMEKLQRKKWSHGFQ